MKNDGSIGVAITVKDGDKFNKSLADVNKSLKITQSEIKLAGAKTKEFGNDTKSLSEKQKALENHTKNLNDKVKLYSESINKNSSNLKTNRSDLEQLSNKKKDLNSKINEAVKMYGKESDEVKKLEQELSNVTKEYKSKEQQVKNNINAINKHSAEINKCEAELIGVQGELQRTNKALQTNSSNWTTAGQKLGTASKNMKNVGDKANKAGNAMLAMSAPLVAFGGYATKVSADFEKGMDTVQSLSQASADDMVLLTDKAKEMGRITSKSASDSAEGLQYMALAGWDTKEMLDGLEPILRLSEVSGASLGQTSDLVTDSLSALGLTAQDSSRYLDVVAKTQASANTSATQMLEAYIGVGGVMKSLNVPLEESATWIGVLGNRGIKSSEAGNALSSTLINLTTGAGQAGTAMEKLGISAFDSEGKFKGIEGTLRELDESLKGASEEQRNYYLSMIGGKTNVDTLNALLSGLNEEYSSLKTTVTDSNGALNEMAKVMQDNTKGNVDRLKSNLEALGITFGEKLLPHVNTMIEGLNNLINWFGSLDDETQNTIIKFGALSVASGGALKVFGGLANATGSVLGGLSKVATNLGKTTKDMDKLSKSTELASGSKGVAGLTKSFGGLTKVVNPVGIAIAGVAGAMYTLKEANDFSNASVLKTREEMSLMERGFSKLTGTSVYTKEELEKLGYTYKDFSEINEDTAKVLEYSSQKFRELGSEIDRIGLDGVITPEESEGVITRTNELCNGIIGEIRARESESKEAWTQIFNVDGVIDEQEQRILDKIKGQADSEAEAVQNKNNRINELMRINAEEQRNLTVEEQAELDRLVDELNQAAIESFKLTEEEKLKVKQNYIDRSYNMDVKSLSDMLTEQANKRDESITKTKEEYDGKINAMKDGLAGLEGEDRAFAEKKISDLERDKELAIQKEKDKYSEYVKVAQENSPKLLAELDKHNGKILSNQEKNLQKQISDMSSRYADMNKVTESGMYKMYNTQTKSWNDVQVVVDQKSGKITGIWDTTINRIAGKQAKLSVEEDANNDGKFDNIKTKWWNTKNDIESNPIQSTIVFNENRQGGATKYATGTSNSIEGVAEVNENGWELMSEAPKTLVDIAGREYAYLNKGTRIQTHATSVASMKADVQAEVSKQMSKTGDVKALMDELSKTLSKTTGKEININVDKMNLLDKGDEKKNINYLKFIAGAF